ncbi:hypothetical protein [Nocardioides sp. 616]|uniref:hypothetical protein n=1 Tax=Nocardioides sp. 616 TaxID=2268090 RepID=UPI001963FCEC|nr:hypothetical protein [Nocardioides sp. 616]
MITKRPRADRPAVLRAAGLAVAVGVGLSACTSAGTAFGSHTDRAQELAGKLNENLAAVGLLGLDTSTAIALYGTDGGVSCENVGELQQELSLSQFGNNSIHLRRVVLDPRVVAHDLAVIKTYCPDEVASFQDVIDKLKTEETMPRQ